MWSEEPFDASDDLRQGDLIQGFWVPKLKLPLLLTATLGSTPGHEDYVLSKLGKKRYLLVVSQCCTVQNDKIAAVAPIQSSKVLSEEQLAIYQNTVLPQEEGDLPYAFTHHYIEPYRDAHPEPLTGGRVNIASFLDIQTMSGDLDSLKLRRVARMTAVARRNLRRNLQAFWGRTEDEDRKALTDAGEDLE